MNTLKRRMFKDGNEVNTSLSPAILTYVNELGIDPEGKTAAELQAEIKLTLEGQDAENAPGLFRTYAFDYKDPLDYAAAGLALTGIGIGGAAALKTANIARKLKKIKDAAARAAKAANPVVRKGGINVPGKIGFQARNKLDPRSYIYKPKQSALYGTGLGVGVGMMGDDSISTSLMPDQITNELKKLAENEQVISEQKDQVNAEQAAKQKAKKEKDEINATLGFLKDAGETFDKEENERISKERRYNANALMQEIGSAMAQTGSIDEGLALGATTAAKRISEEKLAQKLAEDALKKKMLEQNQLSATEKTTIVEKYSDAKLHVGNMKFITSQIDELENLVKTGSVTGGRGLVGRSFGKLEGFLGFGDEQIQGAEKAKQIGQFIQAQLIRELLNESGRTISNLDRQLIQDIVGDVADFTKGRGSILETIQRIRQKIQSSVNKSNNTVKFYKAEYGKSLPNLALFDEGNEFQSIREIDDAVINADEIEV